MTLPRILLPALDDTMLMFAASMRRLLVPLAVPHDIALIEGGPLSDRQRAQHLPEGPDLTLPPAALGDASALSDYDALVVNRQPWPLKRLVQPSRGGTPRDRPVLVVFQSGLDLTPEIGFANRRDVDVTFLTPRSRLDRFRRAFPRAPHQRVAFGHPTFRRPGPPAPRPDATEDVYFFTQAISPATLGARLHMLDILIAMARARPDRNVWIKLRHLPEENRDHLHRERWSYPDLLAQHRPDAPSNLRVTDCTIAEAMARAGRGLACTSTAVVDLIRAGIPVQVYTDYVENYLDPLAAPMVELFGQSGLIASLDEVLDGVTRAPAQKWLEDFFCEDDLAESMLREIAAVRAAV